LGSSQGGHNGLSLIGNFLNVYGARTGVGIVCANGNEANNRHHCSGKISEIDGYYEAQLRVDGKTSGFTMELWAESPDIFEIEIISPTGERIPRVNSNLEREQMYSLLLERTRVYVKYELVERLSGSELIQVRFEMPTEGIWTIKVYGELIISGEFNIWLPINEFVGEDTYFLKPDPYITLTTPSDTFIPISVGAYSNYTQGIYINSGRGYTIDNTVKPTFVAPGVNVLAPSVNNSYIRLSGTSVAAGITAGVMAQFMEWGIVKGNRINMNTTEIKSYLMRGAKRKAALTYPNQEWGFGELDAYNSIDILRN
jgi:subtilisin family serine protease